MRQALVSFDGLVLDATRAFVFERLVDPQRKGTGANAAANREGLAGLVFAFVAQGSWRQRSGGRLELRLSNATGAAAFAAREAAEGVSFASRPNPAKNVDLGCSHRRSFGRVL